MNGEFIKYRTFNYKALATELCGLLSSHDIPFAWESTEGFFDVSIANNDILNLYYFKLKPGDFKRADELPMNAIAEDPQPPVADYYLFSFSNDELKDVLTKPDEWNAFDLYWAKKILSARGAQIDEEAIELVKKERLTELKQPWILDKLWLTGAFALWLVALWFLHVYAAPGVIVLGTYISFGKKTMPDGDRVNAFSATDRLLGKIVLLLGIVTVLYLFLIFFGFIDFMYPL